MYLVALTVYINFSQIQLLHIVYPVYNSWLTHWQLFF